MRHSPAQACGHADAERGVSLVELMLLLSVSVVFIGSLLSGVVALSSERQLREERVLAVNACRNVLEDLRRETVANLQAANGRGFAVPGINGNGIGLKAASGDPDNLPGSISVRPERTYGTSVLYRVIVSVDWDGASPHSHEHVTTLMGRRR